MVPYKLLLLRVLPHDRNFERNSTLEHNHHGNYGGEGSIGLVGEPEFAVLTHCQDSVVRA